ncbi:MAG TPA: YdcF family protein, partial [bacterium]|nr:YdcF family protein [bacterium]
SAELMADAALAAGVPRDALVVEHDARTTRENVVFSMPLLVRHGVKSVAVVTDRYHARRAALAAAHAWPGITVISRPVPDDDARGCSLAAWARDPACERAFRSEWRKLLGYALNGWL